MKPLQDNDRRLHGRQNESSKETEDNHCDLDPTKICDNCFKCLETDSDYASVEIDGIYMNGERIY